MTLCFEFNPLLAGSEEESGSGESEEEEAGEDEGEETSSDEEDALEKLKKRFGKKTEIVSPNTFVVSIASVIHKPGAH